MRLLRLGVALAVLASACAGGVNSTSTSTSTPTSTTTSTSTSTSELTSTTSTSTAVAPGGGATAIALVGDDLVELDTATGEVTRVISEFFGGDGVYRGSFSLTPDRSWLYFSEGWEDSWYSCESSPGRVGRVNLETAKIEELAIGSGAIVSTDGTYFAYLEASQCLPDPLEPDNWVITPYDRAVVVDLRTDERVELSTAVLPTSYEDPNGLSWVGFHPDGDVLVLTAAGTLHKVPMSGAISVQASPVLLTGALGWPVDVVDNGLLMVDWTEDSVALYALDFASGRVTTLLSSGSWIEAAVSPSGEVIAATEDRLFPYLEGPIDTPAWVFGIDW